MDQETGSLLKAVWNYEAAFSGTGGSVTSEYGRLEIEIDDIGEVSVEALQP